MQREMRINMFLSVFTLHISVNSSSFLLGKDLTTDAGLKTLEYCKKYRDLSGGDQLHQRV